MSYYAHGGGRVMLNGYYVPEEVLLILNQDFSWVERSPDNGLWFEFEENRYYDDKVREGMNKLAPYVKSGNVTFTGEDGESWRFSFYNGKVRYEVGRMVYYPENKDERHSERLELLGVLADIVEDWLESKGITPEDIPCEDRDQAIIDGEDPEGLAMIYGEDYDHLTGEFEELLINYGLIEKE